jgi:hypothetical protein
MKLQFYSKILSKIFHQKNNNNLILFNFNINKFKKYYKN